MLIKRLINRVSLVSFALLLCALATLMEGHVFWQDVNLRQAKILAVEEKVASGEEGDLLINVMESPQFKTVMEAMFENDAFQTAWLEFETAIHEVQLADLSDKHTKGTSQKEVDKYFSVEPEVGKYSNGVIRYYHYQGEKIFVEETGEPSNASIVAYFERDQLIHLAVANSTVMLYPDKFVSEEQAREFDKNQSDIVELFALNPIILGVGYRRVESQPMLVIPVPTGDIRTENAWVDFYHVKESKIESIRSLTLGEALENQHSSMISAFNNYNIEHGYQDKEVFFKLHRDEVIENEE